MENDFVLQQSKLNDYLFFSVSNTCSIFEYSWVTVDYANIIFSLGYLYW